MKISVKVKPKAKTEKVIRKTGGSFEVWIKAPPIDGRANEATSAVLAKFLGIGKNSLRLALGAKSKQKVFEI